MCNDDLTIKSQKTFIKSQRSEVNPISRRETQSITIGNVANRTQSSCRTAAHPTKGDEHQVTSIEDIVRKPNHLHTRPHPPSHKTVTQTPPRLTTNTKGDGRGDATEGYDPTKEVEGPIPALQIEVMKKAERILSKYKNKLHLEFNPQSKQSWLIHTIDKAIQTPKQDDETTQSKVPQF